MLRVPYLNTYSLDERLKPSEGHNHDGNEQHRFPWNEGGTLWA